MWKKTLSKVRNKLFMQKKQCVVAINMTLKQENWIFIQKITL